MDNEETSLVLFGPTSGKRLKREFPELARNPLFDPLSDDELHFAWLMGCKSSPIDEGWTESFKHKQAAYQVFPKGSDKRTNYASMDVPVNVKEAIEEMRKYSPDARMLAKKTTQENFHTLQKLCQYNEDNFKVKNKDSGEIEINWVAKRQLVDMIAKTSEIMPVLIKQLEEGYGIVETKKKSEETGVKPIDEWHQNKKSKA